MANRRTQLSSIRRSIAQRNSVNAAAWFAGQSFNSGTRGDLPVTQMSIKQLDAAGAGLLPKPDLQPTKRCAWCGGENRADDELYCSSICAIDAQGDI